MPIIAERAAEERNERLKRVTIQHPGSRFVHTHPFFQTQHTRIYLHHHEKRRVRLPSPPSNKICYCADLRAPRCRNFVPVFLCVAQHPRTHLEIRRHFSAVVEGDFDAPNGRKSHGVVIGEGELQAPVFAAPRPVRASSL